MNTLSIITINYNNKDGLKKTMNSVFAQSYKDFEYIIIDGGSTDGSLELVTENKHKLHYWVSEKDEGIYHAQNKGIAQSKAEYCLFLNSGDTLADNFVLGDVLKYLGTEDIVYGDLVTVDLSGKRKNLSSPDDPDVYHFMISTLWHPTTFIRRQLFLKYGMYEQLFKVTGDYEFFIRTILKHNVSVKHIKRPICVFELSGISNSETMRELQTQERKLSWELNFSKKVIETFEQQTKILRSREYALANFFRKLFKPFSQSK